VATGPRTISLTLQATDYGLRVTYRVDGVRFPADAVVAQLPVQVAGIPTPSVDLALEDDAGAIPLLVEPTSLDDEAAVRWRTTRATRGAVRATYPARARTVSAGTADGHPPVDLRFEANGVTGQGRSFLALPPGDDPWEIGLTWAFDRHRGGTGVCSLGAGDLELSATPLESLLHCHFMAGEVTTLDYRRPAHQRSYRRGNPFPKGSATPPTRR